MTEKKYMLDFQQIQNALPHRFPFLLIDRVLEIDPGKYCKALKNVSGGEEVFQGHFPGSSVMPGVLVVEAMAQAGGIAIFSSVSHLENPSIFFAGIEQARFKRPVVPGDQLILETELKSQRQSLWVFKCKASVDGLQVAQAEVKIMINEKKS